MRTRVGAVVATVVVAVVGAAGCTSSATLDRSRGSSSVAATSVQNSGPTVSVAPADGSRAVRPDTPVVVTVAGGAVKTAQLATADGQRVQGRVDGSGGWQTTDALKPATRYTLKVTAANDAGVTTTKTTSFTTLTPQAFNRVVLVPGDDWRVGVGMPVVATFTTPVTNKGAAEKALTVSSRPRVKGAWRWVSSTQVQWRPEKYWPAGTKVKVTAAVGGVELASGVWGRRTVTSSFTVGRAQVSTVDVKKHTLTVRRDGKVIRVIPVTTGMTNSKPGFVTRGGVKVIMSREPSVRMDAASTGTDPKDPNYYNLVVHWALRLTWSGEFLHAAPWSVAAQGRQNVSHGCTGMSDANAKWMYDHSQVGDVVVYEGSKRPIEPGNGYTAWNMSFGDWASGT